MKIRPYSDLHLDCRANRVAFPPAQPDEVIVLAGDIMEGLGGIEWAGLTFSGARAVLYVLGNNEFYGCASRSGFRRKAIDYARACNVVLLDDNSVDINGVRFIGSTLWTNYALFGDSKVQEAMDQCAANMVAHQRIMSGAGRLFTPGEALSQHCISRVYLERSLRITNGLGIPSVVISHHGPHKKSVPASFAKDALTPGFVSHMPELVGRASMWVHGHTHTKFDYMADGCRVICNPVGRSDESCSPSHEPILFPSMELNLS